MLKALTLCVGMFVFTQAAAPVPQQEERSATVTRQGSSRQTDNTDHFALAAHSGRDAQLANAPTPKFESEPGRPTYPQPHISFTVSNASPSPWTWHERVAWTGNLGLAIIGYVGIVIAIRALKVIAAQTKCLEALAQTAIETSDKAGQAMQGLINSQRPWVLMAVTRSVQVDNSFSIVATNRGSAQAQITSCPDRVIQITNDPSLTAKIDSLTEELNMLATPILLLPGESTVIQRFGRGDVKWVCKTEESLHRVEQSVDTIYIYGTIFYKCSATTNNTQTHQTDWCFKYIHGAFISDLAMGGSFDPLRHT